MATANARRNEPEGSKAGEKLAVLASISSRFDQVMEATENMRKEINDCAERVAQREVCISNAEGVIEMLRAKANGKVLEEKVLDLASRSRGNNLRLTNLPEGAEGRDPL